LMLPVELMLQQQLGIFVDCVAQPLETISRLGCSCIRYVTVLSSHLLGNSYCVVVRGS